jgi:chemotaxis signal transduction protein
VASLTKYLTFRAARLELACDASSVRGILPISELVALAGVRPELLGVATTSGRQIAVFDLCAKLHLPCPGQGRQILVVEIIVNSRSHWTGFVVDRVSDMLTYRARDLRRGSLHGQGRTRKLVDFNPLVSESELAGLSLTNP